MGFLTLRTDTNKVNVSGIDQPEADMVSYSDGLMIIKVPGFSYSFSAHPSLDGMAYAKAEYQVWEVEEFQVHGLLVSLQARRRASFPTRGAVGKFPVPQLKIVQ